jgi:hypothetical protein
MEDLHHLAQSHQLVEVVVVQGTESHLLFKMELLEVLVVVLAILQEVQELEIHHQLLLHKEIMVDLDKVVAAVVLVVLAALMVRRDLLGLLDLVPQ